MNDSYKTMIESNYEKHNKILKSVVTCKKLFNEFKASSNVNELIIEQVLLKKTKYKKDFVIKIKDAKSIIKKIFNQFDIKESPKGVYLLKLIKKSKQTNVKIDNKVTGVIRWKA